MIGTSCETQNPKGLGHRAPIAAYVRSGGAERKHDNEPKMHRHPRRKGDRETEGKEKPKTREILLLNAPPCGSFTKGPDLYNPRQKGRSTWHSANPHSPVSWLVFLHPCAQLSEQCMLIQL